MSLLEYNEVVERKYIVVDGQPYEVLDSHVFRKQQRKPVNATKLKNLMTGKTTEKSFHQSEKIEEAEIISRDVKYLFNNRGVWWFCEAQNPAQRFSLTQEQVTDRGRFLKANSVVSAITFEEQFLGIKFPITVDLKVVEAAPAVKGDTITGGSKMVKLETGAEVQVPLFIVEGEVIRINTETGEYRERVGK
ncbi:MAG: elongation factor P [Candidatus Paceibacterota bacterium]|jgi:elongation factor P